MGKFVQLATAFIVSSCVTYKGTGQFSEYKDLNYTQSDSIRQKADLYIPNSEIKELPAVVLVHGGGWATRGKEDMSAVAESLVSHGYIVLNINYRFAPEHKHPKQIDDLESSIKFLKNEMSRRGYRITKLALWGYSSGGHISSYYALTRAKDSSKKVDAVIAGGTPFDFTWYPFSPYISKYLGKYRDEMMDEYIEASPITHVSKDAPPFFIYHAEKDELLEHSQATAFEFRLKAVGVHVERYTVGWWGHVFAFAFSKESVVRSIQFLDKMFK